MQNRETNYILRSIVLDVFSTLLAVALSIWLREILPLGRSVSDWRLGKMRILFWQAGLLYPILFTFLSLYDSKRTFRWVSEVQILIRASIIVGLALAGLVYFTDRDISRLSMIYFFVIHFAIISGWRFGARLMRYRVQGKQKNVRRILVIGSGDVAKTAIEKLGDLEWNDIYYEGYLSPSDDTSPSSFGKNYLGEPHQADRIIREKNIDDVIIAMPVASYKLVEQITQKLFDKPCNIWVVPDYFNLLFYGSKVDDLGGVPIISLKTPTLTGYQRVTKRAMDLFISTLGMIPALPLMMIISIAIKLDSKGPVLFLQPRIGENGKGFHMIKFRSMVEDAEKQFQSVLQKDPAGNIIHKREKDPRITRIGRFLRKTSLDELPQLFNVFKGEMSLVGPRPELPYMVEHYQPWQHKRFAVPQGITGWWQVNGRSDKPMHLNTEDDLYYVHNYSLGLDFRILLKTIWVVVKGRGAY